MNKLQAAVNAGETDLYNQVTSEESQCPGERFVIAGFSQGAMVVGQFARDHPGLSAGSGGPVSGIIMWADPEFNGNDSLSKGADPGGSVFISSSGWLGFIGWYYNQRYTFPSAWSGRAPQLLHERRRGMRLEPDQRSQARQPARGREPDTSHNH